MQGLSAQVGMTNQVVVNIPMYAQCPSCKTLFAITTEQLQAALGRAHCGSCGRVFNAALNLRHHNPSVGEAQPADDEAAAVPQHGAAREAEIGQLYDSPEFDIIRPAEAKPRVQRARRPEAALDSDDMHYPVVTQSDLYAESVTPPGTQIGWFVGSVMLVVFLFFQTVLVMRPEWEQIPEYRPIVVKLCKFVACNPAPFRSIEDVQLVERRISPHPERPDVLRVTAALVNTASISQVFPKVQLKFTDLTGRTLALRRFSPQEYLRDPDPQIIREGIAPNQPVYLFLELVDVGKNAMAYEFEFL